MPLALLPSGKLPALVTDDGPGHSRLNEMGLELKSRVFTLKKGNNTNFYGNLAPLFNKKGKGILQQILPIEEEVMHRGEVAVAELRKSKDENRWRLITTGWMALSRNNTKASSELNEKQKEVPTDSSFFISWSFRFTPSRRLWQSVDRRR